MGSSYETIFSGHLKSVRGYNRSVKLTMCGFLMKDKCTKEPELIGNALCKYQGYKDTGSS